MSLSGGGSRDELRPLKPDGNVEHDLAGHHVVGNHKGQFGYFNVVDPAPGTVHEYATKEELLGCRQRGWWHARPEDGRPASDLMTPYQQQPGTPIDSKDSAFPGYYHMVTSEENFRRLMEERARLSREQLAPAGMGYLEGVSEEEYELAGRGDHRHPSRFATRDHGTFVAEGDRVLEHLTPRGLQREEDL